MPLLRLSLTLVILWKFLEVGGLRPDDIESLVQEAAGLAKHRARRKRGLQLAVNTKLREDCKSQLEKVPEQNSHTGPACRGGCLVKMMLQREEERFMAFKTSSFKTHPCSVLIEVPFGTSDKETMALEADCPAICMADDNVLEYFEHSVEERLCTKVPKDRKQMCSVIIEEA
eukprot:symbB.v1.2.029335.t1/scaffold3199.1/size61439/5